MKKLVAIAGFLLASTPAWSTDCQYRATTPTLSDQDLIILQCDNAGRLLQGPQTPSSAPAAGIAPVASTTLESSHVFKASAGNLYAYQVTTTTAAGYILIFDATSAPADGAVTPKKCVPTAAGSVVGVTMNPPEAFSTGITLAFSTTGCFTKTASATAYFSADYK